MNKRVLELLFMNLVIEYLTIIAAGVLGKKDEQLQGTMERAMSLVENLNRELREIKAQMEHLN